jgi:cobalamin biosynthesis protein CobW
MTELSRTPCTVITGFLGLGQDDARSGNLIGKHAKGKRHGPHRQRVRRCRRRQGEILEGLRRSRPARRRTSIELANGCICCTVADDFVPTHGSDPARRSPTVDHIVIETSGLALPQPLVQCLPVAGRMKNRGHHRWRRYAVVDAAALSATGQASPPTWKRLVDAQRAADSNRSTTRRPWWKRSLRTRSISRRSDHSLEKTDLDR